MKIGTDGVLLGAWASVPYPEATAAMDAGAGCGLIALMLAQRFPLLRIDAVEIDPEAALDAAGNIAASPWGARIRPICASFAVMEGPYDLVVSNPPFFTSGEQAPLAARAAARHAGSLSPVTLVETVRGFLNPVGTLAMITPPEQEAELIYRAALARMYPRRICAVSPRPDKGPVRLLWEFSPTDGPLIRSTMVLRRADGSLSDEFASLTRDFYLNI